MSMLKLSVACSMLFFSACVSASKEEKLHSEQQQVYSQMKALLSDKSCSTVADCGVIPVGNMACGGPASYMAYSISMGEDKISELKALAERTKQLDKKLNKISGMMSPCVYHSEPALVCENNICATSYEPSNSIGVKSDVQ